MHITEGFLPGSNKLAHIVLARHGETVFNKSGQWSGRKESPLTENGKEQAQIIAQLVNDINFNAVYTSTSEKTISTWAIMHNQFGCPTVRFVTTDALLERDAGQYAGLTPAQIREKFDLTEDRFEEIRVGWREQAPGGETREQVYMRVSRYYNEYILPDILKGNNVCVVAHNIPILALIMRIERRPEVDMRTLDFGRAQALCYTIDLTTQEPIRKIVRSKK